jgi:hypothetical protein
MRRLEDLLKRQVQIQNNTTFLKKCSKQNIIPKGFNMELITNRFGASREISYIKEKLEIKLVKTTMNLNYKELHELDFEIKKIKTSIREEVPEYWSWICHLTNHSQKSTNSIIKERQINKFNKLMEDKYAKLTKKLFDSTLNQKQYIHNLSSHMLTKDEADLLNLGLNYALPMQDIRIPMMDTAATIELKMFELETPDIQKDKIRHGVSQIMRRHINISNYKTDLEKWIKTSINSLKKNKSLCICKADKGNAVVILDRTDYNNKMMKMIAEGPYEKLSDPTQDFSQQIAKKCQQLLDQKQVSEKEFESLVIKEPRPPLIYGAPKIHKDGVPLRPVVDFRMSPTYNVASFLSKILKQLALNHEYTVKNSTEFVKEISSLKTRCGDQKVSFDVVSMFTKVPIEESLQYIKWKLENFAELKELTKIEIKDIMILLKICLDSTYFKFLDEFYYQKEGTAMGSPISPIVAELFMQNLEDKVIKTNRHIRFWRRYVDDACSIVNGRKVEELLHNLNSFHASIQFTLEREIDGKLNFLDTTIYEKADRSIGYCVHRKATHTNKYLNFSSFHPMAHKIGVIDTLLTRAFRLSDEAHLSEEIIHTIDILENNGYPEKLLLKRLKHVKDKVNAPSNLPKTNQSRIILPWTGPVTSKITKFLKKNLQVELGFYPGIKLCRILCNAKEKQKKVICGVYSIKCANCPSVYVGETGRDVMIRIGEHQQDIRRAAIRKSPVAFHMHENGHELDIQSHKIITQERRKYYRKFKEAIYIKQALEKMNTSKGMPISPFWSSTLVTFLNYDQ